jgi:hypothetical protein
VQPFGLVEVGIQEGGPSGDTSRYMSPERFIAPYLGKVLPKTLKKKRTNCKTPEIEGYNKDLDIIA